MFLSQEITVCAAHKLCNPALSDEDNKRAFGACNNIHGHNYIVTVTLQGKPDPVTGMICNVLDLEDAIKKCIEPMDHHWIDNDIEWFKNRCSTMENIAIYLWENLKENLKNPDQLYEVKVAERGAAGVAYRGN